MLAPLAEEKVLLASLAGERVLLASLAAEIKARSARGRSFFRSAQEEASIARSRSRRHDDCSLRSLSLSLGTHKIVKLSGVLPVQASVFDELPTYNTGLDNVSHPP